VPKAIIFDLDDTIIAYDTVTEQVWDNVCRRFASEVDSLKAESLYNAIGQAREWYWADPERSHLGRINLFKARREIVSLAFSYLHIDSPELANRIADAFSIEREEAVYIIPEAIDTLTHLRKKGVRLALITNGASEMQRAKILRFGLEPFFDSILIEGEFGSGKPDSRVFTHTLEKLNIGAADAWMVGDDLGRDIAPCQPLGIFSVWVDWRGTGLPPSGKVEPDKIIRHIGELLPLTSK
jgi:putative hydrolase of the HAD superfamily